MNSYDSKNDRAILDRCGEVDMRQIRKAVDAYQKMYTGRDGNGGYSNWLVDSKSSLNVVEEGSDNLKSKLMGV
ncbi:hypothetical protein CMI38_07240 [Candidatus Pacearchaeota archaeon]|nr:hypothetical protein [Candidatus Pacearchaeota archaeon]